MITITLTPEEGEVLTKLLKERSTTLDVGSIETKVALAKEKYDRAERLRLFETGAPCHEACQG